MIEHIFDERVSVLLGEKEEFSENLKKFKFDNFDQEIISI